MTQYVVWFDSSETGAPVLNNAAGSLIAVLDACLVTGFNTKAITSLVVAGGVATATCAGHGFSGVYSKDLLLAGATPAGLNGRKALTFVDANTFQYDATGISDQTATGTITAKRDPLGWVKEFTGANKAIYKRSDVTATTMMLRVLDTAEAPASTTAARVQMIEGATDIDTLTAPSPPSAYVADGLGGWWSKGLNSATAKQWSLVGDSKTFILFTQDSSTVLPVYPNAGGGAGHQAFGDFYSYKTGDAYNAFLVSGQYDQGGGATCAYGLAYQQGYAAPPQAWSITIARQLSQADGAVPAGVAGGATGVSGSSQYPVYPSPMDGGYGVQLGMPLVESNAGFGYPTRGILPGLGVILSRYPFAHHAIDTGLVGAPDKRLMSVSISSPAGIGAIVVDLTGPWTP